MFSWSLLDQGQVCRQPVKAEHLVIMLGHQCLSLPSSPAALPTCEHPVAAQMSLTKPLDLKCNAKLLK
jgi:hypothetical protein